MIYYVYFDAYGNPRKAIGQQELSETYGNDTGRFLEAMCRGGPDTAPGHRTGHVGTLAFADESELNEYLESLGEEIEGFYGCRSESRPYNF
jgi:hypothetical protein